MLRIPLRQFPVLFILILGSSAFLGASYLQEFKSGIIWPEPTVIDPGTASKAPSDAVVLFDGSNLDAFKNGEAWNVENGIATVGKKTIETKQSFGDCQIHLEFATPKKVKGKGQGRGNSGVYIMGRYEVQILDSYQNKTYFDGQCGAIYKQQPPTVNACRGPGQWQTYDILFTAPRFDSNKKLVSPAYLTVLHNGVLIHNHFELQGGTSWSHRAKYTPHPEKLPLRIQNHGNPVQFRNIWIRENVAPLVGENPKKAPIKHGKKQENNKSNEKIGKVKSGLKPALEIKTQKK